MTAEQLRKSILQMAVQGKLVPQDPNDEPVHILLERIRAEKERLIKEKKIKKEKNPSIIYRGTDNLHYEKFADGTVNCLKDEIPFEIPESWVWVRLSSLGEIVGGGTPKTSVSTYWDNGNIPWITPADMKCVTGKYIEKGSRNITEDGLKNSSACMMPTGTIIYSSRAPIGYIAITSTSLCTNQGFKSFVPIFTYISNYIYYCLIALTDEIRSRASGTTFKEISGTELGNTLIPFPPYDEQNHIVRQIEKVLPFLSEYDTVDISLRKLTLDFPIRLRKSILQHAVQGKLVPQDESDEPASVLLERIRAEKEELIKQGKLKKDKHESIIFRRDNSYYERLDGVERCIDDEIPFEIPNHWHWERMGNISFITKLAGFEYTKYISPAITAKGIPLLKGKNVQNSIFVENFESYIPESTSDFLNRSQLTKKCILTPYVGSIGNVAIFHGNYKAHLGSNIGKIELYTTDLLEEYVVRYLHSNTGYEQLIKHKKATAQDSISMAALRDVLIPLPPTFEQERIIDKINNILSLVKKQ